MLIQQIYLGQNKSLHSSFKEFFQVYKYIDTSAGSLFDWKSQQKSFFMFIQTLKLPLEPMRRCSSFNTPTPAYLYMPTSSALP